MITTDAAGIANLFGLFLKEKIYHKRVSPKTLTFYRQSWGAYRRVIDGLINRGTGPNS